MYFFYDYDNEMEYCPFAECPFCQWGFRSPDGYNPGPGMTPPGQNYPPGGPQHGQNYPPGGPQHGQNYPPGGHGQQPNFPPGGPQPGGMGMPKTPPPAHIPQKSQAQVKAVSPGSLRPCTYRFVYLWVDNGRGFWAWLTRVDRRTASGWRWNGRRWVYFGVDLRRIDYFVCY